MDAEYQLDLQMIVLAIVHDDIRESVQYHAPHTVVAAVLTARLHRTGDHRLPIGARGGVRLADDPLKARSFVRNRAFRLVLAASLGNSPYRSDLCAGGWRHGYAPRPDRRGSPAHCVRRWRSPARYGWRGDWSRRDGATLGVGMSSRIGFWLESAVRALGGRAWVGSH